MCFIDFLINKHRSSYPVDFDKATMLNSVVWFVFASVLIPALLLFSGMLDVKFFLLLLLLILSVHHSCLYCLVLPKGILCWTCDYSITGLRITGCVCR